jgi:broad specificity phosphatase PhoE
MDLQKALKRFSMTLDHETGHLFYDTDFTPLKISSEVVIVRHGETYGNCGQSTKTGDIHHELVRQYQKDKNNRIFQGNIDKEVNQLTQIGKQQAYDVALKLESTLLAQNWIPDIIFHSPLRRAEETGLPFIKRNGLAQRYYMHHLITEMSFGAWENRRISDMHRNHFCHSLYLDQNALAKETGMNVYQIYQNAECFAEVLLRAIEFFCELEKSHSHKKILLFSHSMFGAACCILFGNGQKVDNGQYLAFDGKRDDNTDYTIPFARPIMLNVANSGSSS